MEGFNHLAQMGEEIEKAIAQVVKKAALDVQAKAQNWVVVDTGFLKSSIYTVTYDSSTFAQASSRGAHRNEFQAMLPEVEPPATQQEALVAVGAEYGVYVEYGTRDAPAQPYLTPAAEAVAPSFTEAMSRLEDKLGKLGG